MSQSQGRLFDEFAKLMNDAAGVAQSARREVETVMRSQADRFASEMDLVRREDLEIAQDLATRALSEVERLSARVAALEGQIAVLMADSRKGATAGSGPVPDGAAGGA
ncbi:accessory factor UbiK family protein [Chthonobacter rhizosphaerae]|uniref:accessory factor UbiK family protein n=1 Tax=Chthonobacter rhizosphaerae TaxID=2735553 RepID=UPI0015EFC76B|nr:accessory factor UbiK family protein [Chthonobacter rhizosphaerae]